MRRRRKHNPRRPPLTSAIYRKRVRPRGWARGFRVDVDVLTGPEVGGKLLRKRLPGWTKADHLKAAKDALRRADRLATEWNRVVNQAARAAWGRDWQPWDYRISGIGSDEFSSQFKDRLRKLAHAASDLKRIAWSHQKAGGKRLIGPNPRHRRRGRNPKEQYRDRLRCVHCGYKKRFWWQLCPQCKGGKLVRLPGRQAGERIPGRNRGPRKRRSRRR